jgi:hypothetical protein
LIDIIGNVFSYERPFYRDFKKLFVLTILTQKFKYVLNSKYHVEFSRYLNLTSINTRHRQHDANEFDENECDFDKYKGSNYKDMEVALANFTASCKHKIKEHCNNITSARVDDDAKVFCERFHNQKDVNMPDDDDGNERRSNSNGVQLNDFTFNKQLVFSEHFNLFDFITSIMKSDEGWEDLGELKG